MSLLPWSLFCMFIFSFWRCSSGTNLVACGLSAFRPTLLRHQKPWPRIKACTTAFSVQDWYGVLSSVSAETQSRFSFSPASLSPVYSVLSRRIRRSFGYRQSPVPLPWPWCYFHESAVVRGVRQRIESEEYDEKCICSSCIQLHRTCARRHAGRRERSGDQGARNDRPAKRDGGPCAAIRESERPQGDYHIRPRRRHGETRAGGRDCGLAAGASERRRRLDQSRQGEIGLRHWSCPLKRRHRGAQRCAKTRYFHTRRVEARAHRRQVHQLL